MATAEKEEGQSNQELGMLEIKRLVGKRFTEIEPSSKFNRRADDLIFRNDIPGGQYDFEGLEGAFYGFREYLGYRNEAGMILRIGTKVLVFVVFFFLLELIEWTGRAALIRVIVLMIFGNELMA